MAFYYSNRKVTDTVVISFREPACPLLGLELHRWVGGGTGRVSVSWLTELCSVPEDVVRMAG